ncbi:anti-sigma factor [Amycolatopsis sp. NPDC004368]
MREMQEFLEAIPPELLLNGPPDDADLLLQRTLRQVRAEASGTRRRGRTLAATAAVAVAAAALGLGALVGHAGTSAPPLLPAAAPDPDVAVAPSHPDPLLFTGSAGPTHLSAEVTAAHGWVRVEAHVQGLPDGTRCRLVVLGKDGTRQATGGWQFSTTPSGAGAELYGSASMPASDIAAVTLEDMSGHEFVRTGV